MVSCFEVLKKIPDKKIGEGGLICMAEHIMPIADNAWIIPVDMI